MTGGLFALNCPNCGSEISIDHRGNCRCGTCWRGYLNRFGYLILIESEYPLDNAPDRPPVGLAAPNDSSL